MKDCPYCNLPLRGVGEVFSSVANGIPFAGLCCEPCATRHESLPSKARHRAMLAAVRRIERNPDRYAVKAFATEFEARAVVALAADPVTGADAVDVISCG